MPRRRGLPLACALLIAPILALHSRAQSPELQTLRVHGQVSLVASPAGNATIQIGPQGVLVVDTMSAALADPLLAAIRAAAPDKPIRYILNTHANADVTGGNVKVSAAGAQLVAGNFAAQVGQNAVAGTVNNAFILAHENVLNAMSADKGGQPVAPFEAWPTETFFGAEKAMYFNGEGIQLVHVAAAHSDGDILVFFRSSDVISAGEIYSTIGYPRIDRARGGTVNGVIEGLNRIIDLAISEQFTEGGTRIVPGRGRISDEFDVVEYRDMVTIVRDRVQALIKKGRSLEQIAMAQPTIDWDPRYGAATGPWTTAMFVEAVHQSLTVRPEGQRR